MSSCPIIPASIVNFNNQGPLNGITFYGKNSLVLSTNGIYEADFSVTAEPSMSSNLSFKLLDTAADSMMPTTIPGSVYSSSIGTNNFGTVNGNVKFNAKKGNKIQLVNNLLSDVHLGK